LPGSIRSAGSTGRNLQREEARDGDRRHADSGRALRGELAPLARAQKELGRAEPRQGLDDKSQARIREAADAVESLFLDEALIGVFGGFTAAAPPVALAAALALWLQDLDARLTEAEDQASEN
jgi:hypothetical protein